MVRQDDRFEHISGKIFKGLQTAFEQVKIKRKRSDTKTRERFVVFSSTSIQGKDRYGIPLCVYLYPLYYSVSLCFITLWFPSLLSLSLPIFLSLYARRFCGGHGRELIPCEMWPK